MFYAGECSQGGRLQSTLSCPLHPLARPGGSRAQGQVLRASSPQTSSGLQTSQRSQHCGVGKVDREGTLGVTLDARGTDANGGKRGSHRGGEAPGREAPRSNGGQEMALAGGSPPGAKATALGRRSGREAGGGETEAPGTGRGRATAAPLPPRPGRSAGRALRRAPRAGSRRGRGRTPRTPGAGGAPSAAEPRGRPPSPRRPPSGPAPQLAGAPRRSPRPPPRATRRRRHRRASAGAAGRRVGLRRAASLRPGAAAVSGAAPQPRRSGRAGREAVAQRLQTKAAALRRAPGAAAADSVSLASNHENPGGWRRDKCP